MDTYFATHGKVTYEGAEYQIKESGIKNGEPFVKLDPSHSDLEQLFLDEIARSGTLSIDLHQGLLLNDHYYPYRMHP
jgi:hypothetical protein